jgi:DNA-binding MarR family transcriptional regulator
MATNTKDQENPGFLIRRLQQISVMLFLEKLEPLGITPIQLTILRVVHEEPGIDQVSTARRAFLDQSTVTDVAARLEQKGLLIRVPGRIDRRKKVLRLTSEGEAVLVNAGPLADAARKELFSGLTREQKKTVLELISIIVQGKSDEILGGPERRPWGRSRNDEDL